MKLYYNPRSRATIAHWMLEECGVDYELVQIDFEKKEHKTQEFRKINPAGKLPALIDGEQRLYENTAICMYLAEKFPQAGLAVGIDDPQRGRYMTLSVYATSQLEPSMSDVLLKVDNHSARGWTDWETVLNVLDYELGEGPYLLGGQFTTPDILVGASLMWFRQFGNTLPERLDRYVNHVLDRPAAAVLKG